MEQVKIKIGVVSDVVCPWCYIGKRRLEKAMQLAPGFYDFDVEYYPYELNPHIPEEGLDYRGYLCRKFGSESKFHELTRHITRVAADEGLDFRLDRQEVSPNTRNAHRIILLAREEGRQLQVVEAFFRAYFTRGIDLSRIENLVDIAAGVGMDPGKVETLLNSNTGKLEIEMAEKELHDLGITAVPLFIISDHFTITGAQPVAAFSRAFEGVALAKTEWS